LARVADRGEAPVSATAARPRASTRADLLRYVSGATGSVIGSVLRWVLGLALPWGTLFVNISGSFAIGFFAGMTAPGGRWFAGPRVRQFVMTGVCGGYTTFSMFSLETLRMLQQGRDLAAAGYIALSVVAWLGAVWVGDAFALRLNRLRGAKS
jgi:CrcB protein